MDHVENLIVPREMLHGLFDMIVLDVSIVFEAEHRAQRTSNEKAAMGVRAH